jgi:hypothetical protein
MPKTAAQRPAGSLIFCYKKVSAEERKFLAIRFWSDKLFPFMKTTPFVFALLVGALFATVVASSYAGRPAKPSTGTPPPPLSTPVASPR